MTPTNTEALAIADALEKRLACSSLVLTADVERAAAELRRLAAVEAELERERMRLTACGVVALSDTPASAAVARDMHPDYRSASCDDVARRVDECISLRAERDALQRKLQEQALQALTDGTENAELLAERDALRADAERWRSLYRRAINQANGLTNYVEERPELRRAERQLEAIELEARAIDAAMKGTP